MKKVEGEVEMSPMPIDRVWWFDGEVSTIDTLTRSTSEIKQELNATKSGIIA